MSTSQRSKLNYRAFVSLLMLFSFAWLPPSGVILHLTDTGSKPVLRHASMSIHNVAGIIFLIAALVHVIYNAKSIGHYLAVKASTFPSLKREAITALILSVGLILLFASHALHVH